MKRAIELRNDTEKHYNCAQAVLIPFAEEKGLPEDAAYAIAANHGGGLKTGSVCGALTGGLMVLGLYGIDDSKTISGYYRTFRERHEGKTDCRDLLKASSEAGIPKKEHCDGLVYEVVDILTGLISRET